MPYSLTWQVPASIMHLRLIDQITLSDFVEIDLAVSSQLEQCDPYAILLVDISHARSLPIAIEQIRSSQNYARDPRLKWLLIIGMNKLVRLTLLVVFNLSRANIQFFSTEGDAQNFIQRMQSMAGTSPKE